MGVLLPFPTRRRRTRSRRGTVKPAGQPGQINVFPPSRHGTIVATIVSEMLEQATEDAAAETLASHLHSECHRLDTIGIRDNEIEAACVEFARAAWTSFYRGEPSEGIA